MTTDTINEDVRDHIRQLNGEVERLKGMVEILRRQRDAFIAEQIANERDETTIAQSKLVGEIERLREQLVIAKEALTEIACLADERANARLAMRGSYSEFDEPGSVAAAREALTRLTDDLGK